MTYKNGPYIITLEVLDTYYDNNKSLCQKIRSTCERGVSEFECKPGYIDELKKLLTLSGTNFIG